MCNGTFLFIFLISITAHIQGRQKSHPTYFVNASEFWKMANRMLNQSEGDQFQLKHFGSRMIRRPPGGNGKQIKKTYKSNNFVKQIQGNFETYIQPL